MAQRWKRLVLVGAVVLPLFLWVRDRARLSSLETKLRGAVERHAEERSGLEAQLVRAEAEKRALESKSVPPGTPPAAPAPPGGDAPAAAAAPAAPASCQDRHQAQEAKLEGLAKAVEELKAKETSVGPALDALKGEVASLQKALADLKADTEAKTAEIAGLRERIEKLAADRTAQSQADASTASAPSDQLAAGPRIEAEVLRADAGSGVVVLGKGSADGLRLGQELEVLRAGGSAVKLRVVKLWTERPHYAGAAVVGGVPLEPLRAGDLATSGSTPSPPAVGGVAAPPPPSPEGSAALDGSIFQGSSASVPPPPPPRP